MGYFLLIDDEVTGPVSLDQIQEMLKSRKIDIQTLCSTEERMDAWLPVRSVLPRQEPEPAPAPVVAPEPAPEPDPDATVLSVPKPPPTNKGKGTAPTRVPIVKGDSQKITPPSPREPAAESAATQETRVVPTVSSSGVSAAPTAAPAASSVSPGVSSPGGPVLIDFKKSGSATIFTSPEQPLHVVVTDMQIGSDKLFGLANKLVFYALPAILVVFLILFVLGAGIVFALRTMGVF
ncbi:MAG: GYF domain-containing protein [Verrucomicrobiae bacterium]|nr:GYF domain-containing protein [Verrucomicrobiae bacterium]